MYTINVETINGIQKENIYEISELPLLRKLLECKDSKKRKVNYLEIPCAFDIETTNIYHMDGDKIAKEPRPYAFMYVWQFCIDDCVCIGRTWEEFQTLLKTLETRMNLSINNRLVIWVHNLAFEWAFMQKFIDYDSGFFMDLRQPIKIVTTGGIEFRCSYKLSNMSLQKFCENENGVIHYKLSGEDFDYSKIRTANTTLTEKELAYCYNDVRGLCECIKSRMSEFTLASMPMTSTGYVRRDLRSASTKNKKNREKFRNSALNSELYTMCRDAFRGGNTHANLDHSGQIVKNAWGYDITSSYPYSLMLPYYPITAFSKITMNTFNKEIENKNLAMLIHCRFKNIKYINTCGVPYIALSKCLKFSKKRIIDNGRVLYAEFLEAVFTDVDYRIILKDYHIEDISIDSVYASSYGQLPEEIRNVNMDYYRKKTLLKDNPEMAYEYVKSKNKLNSIYGCMVMRIDKPEITYENGQYVTNTIPLDEALAKYYKSRNNFLSYQHGVWIAANSREHLQEMLWKVGKDVIYCDTDSIKGINNHDSEFEIVNKRIIEDDMKMGAYASDASGVVHYLGVWDNETKDKPYTSFSTLGAKKYIYEQDGKIKSTIAGVNKKAGAEYFKKHGLEAFKVGAKITDSGHLTAYYNDDEIHTIKIKGCTMTTASNVALINNSYTIGVTEEYSDLLLKGLENILDIDYI